MKITLGQFTCPFKPWRPEDGRRFDRFSYDTETTLIDNNRPDLTPSYVLGAACDDRQGVFIARNNVAEFFKAHQGVPFIAHNAAFDLKVTQHVLGSEVGLYKAVERGEVWDTQILKRLLSLATTGDPLRFGGTGLADCALEHLGVRLDKGQKDTDDDTVRTSFGQFLGKPASAIPTEYLTYLGHDVIATWHLFWELHGRIQAVLGGSHGAFGFVDTAWLKDVIDRFGPLTHHTQLKASIVTDVLRSNGIGIEQAQQEEKRKQVQARKEECKERLRRQGFLVGEKGSDKALQSKLTELKRKNPSLDLKRTASGEKWSTKEEDLVELAADDPFFTDLAAYKTAEKFLSTYLSKMGVQRLHPRFGFLLATGRTFCGGGFNLQNLPRENGHNCTATIRGCFVPGDENVFIDSDFSQIELVVLGHALRHQFGSKSVLAELVNSGQDVHRLLASQLLGKTPEGVTKEERNSVKPISFGRPGGMGVDGLRRVAKSGYGLELTPEEVQERIDAYHRLCPELDDFLMNEVDSGLVLAEALWLTPNAIRVARGFTPEHDPDADNPQPWLGWMLLKVLRDEAPATNQGRPYAEEEIRFCWDKAQEFSSRFKLDSKLLAKLQCRKPDWQLWKAVRDWAGRRSVFTVTGRLRANTTFCASRNTIFQGTAADGAILALWNVWRAGYKLVDFVHDQLVVESPADDKVHDRVQHIEALMKEGMLAVVPGMLVKVETVVTQSLDKRDLDPRYLEPQVKEVTHVAPTAA